MTSNSYKLNDDQLEFFQSMQARPFPSKPHPNIYFHTLGTSYPSNIIYGHHYTPSINQSAVDYLRNNYSTESNDIFITSYPRCGTHWLMKIIFEIIKYGSKNILN